MEKNINPITEAIKKGKDEVEIYLTEISVEQFIKEIKDLCNDNECAYCEFDYFGRAKQNLIDDTLIIRKDIYYENTNYIIGHVYNLVIGESTDNPQVTPIKFCPKCGRKLDVS